MQDLPTKSVNQRYASQSKTSEDGQKVISKRISGKLSRFQLKWALSETQPTGISSSGGRTTTLRVCVCARFLQIELAKRALAHIHDKTKHITAETDVTHAL